MVGIIARIGILGGTFDPPHNGHLALAHAALQHLHLDRVLWVLTLQPPHKHGQPITPLADRLEMLQAALVEHPKFQLSRVDIDRPPPHYAVDTVACLRQEYPDAWLIYLMGGDSLRDLSLWHTPQAFLNACDALGVMCRPGAAYNLEHLETTLHGISTKVQFMDIPPIDIASSSLRQCIAANLSIHEYLPAAVEKIIRARQLYR
ncbi:MAG: nicotinate (nicotinamide) nucleotide adenylyltransferase [Chloroflexi bacterium]|nr:nicotinate (nicotinamide) nucleotide adenylyltransferase [Chloroflexota bacterium]